MIVVRATYTVNGEYADQNKEMVEAFLTDFKKLDSKQFLYSVFQMGDGKTFVHLSQYQNKGIQQELLNTPSFIQFQEQRDKNLLSEPQIEFLDFIGASRDVF
jgi:hypothetical protein